MEGIKDNLFLITGISSGLGASIAMGIVDQGGRVIGTYRNENSPELINLRKENNIKLLHWDSNQDAEFVANLPLLNGWVHCIGSIHPLPIKYLNSKGKEDLMQTNFLSAVNVSTQLLVNKRLNQSASVVFLSSVSSHFPYRGGSVYAASKAALESFSKSMALECASQKIRVNTLVCGLIKTAMFEASKKVFSDEEMALVEKKYPLGVGVPNDVTGPCLFLLASMSSWMTGSVLTLDGGLLLNTSK